jgi:hypothetical protein
MTASLLRDLGCLSTAVLEVVRDEALSRWIELSSYRASLTACC